MTVLITLTTAGTDTGPFNLYSNVDGYVSAFETGVSKAALLAGYSSALVPNGATTIRIKSTGTCVNYIDVTVVTTTTTTTTTTPPPPPTTTTTTTTAGGFIMKNTSGSGLINDVYGPGGIYFYILTAGSFPIANGQQADGGNASRTGENIIVEISSFSSVSCLSLYINGILNEQIQVNASTTYTFTNKTFTISDNVLIEYVSGVCV